MKKILILLLIVLLGFLGYMCAFKDLQVFDYKILSISSIKKESEKLDEDIKTTKALTTINYQSKIKEIEENSTSLSKEKDEYESLVKLSTTDEIVEATQFEKYEIEYLWTIVGNHATENNVIIKMELIKNNSGINGTFDLNFAVTGSYISITDFIFAVENDSTLQFKIEQFSLLPTAETTSLQAQFTVRDLNINVENEAMVTNLEQTETNNINSSDTQTDTIEQNTEQ